METPPSSTTFTNFNVSMFMVRRPGSARRGRLYFGVKALLQWERLEVLGLITERAGRRSSKGEATSKVPIKWTFWPVISDALGRRVYVQDLSHAPVPCQQDEGG